MSLCFYSVISLWNSYAVNRKKVPKCLRNSQDQPKTPLHLHEADLTNPDSEALLCTAAASQNHPPWEPQGEISARAYLKWNKANIQNRRSPLLSAPGRPLQTPQRPGRVYPLCWGCAHPMPVSLDPRALSFLTPCSTVLTILWSIWLYCSPVCLSPNKTINSLRTGANGKEIEEILFLIVPN